MESEELKLDHFQIYRVRGRRVRRPLALLGLFDEEPVPGELVALDLWANPVMKNGRRLYDKNAHFTIYNLFGATEPTVRVVWAENQFGRQKLYLGPGRRLMVPAQKGERGLVFPRELDHYKVYPVIDTSPVEEARVKLEDQFGAREATLRMPVGYAIPVEKLYRDQRHPIFRKEVHLTLYQIGPRTVEREIRVRDQFGAYGLGPKFCANWLAVPGICHRWEEG